MTVYADGAVLISGVKKHENIPKKPYTDEMIESAMSKAVETGLADGVPIDSLEMRKRILAARAGVKNASVK